MDTLKAFFILPALITPLLLPGWSGADLSWGLYINTVASAILGFDVGYSILSKLLYGIPYFIGFTVYMYMGITYMKYRESIFIFELIIPALIAFIPFGILCWLIDIILKKIDNKSS